jgi:hypothetical protein
LNKITAEDIHAEVDFGEPMGKGSRLTSAYAPDAGDIVWLQFSPQPGHEQAGHGPPHCAPSAIGARSFRRVRRTQR